MLVLKINLLHAVAYMQDYEPSDRNPDTEKYTPSGQPDQVAMVQQPLQEM